MSEYTKTLVAELKSASVRNRQHKAPDEMLDARHEPSHDSETFPFPACSGILEVP